MSTLAELRDRLPDYAKDLRLNLDSITSEAGAPGLKQKQIWLIAYASALATRQTVYAEAVAQAGALSAEERAGAAAAFAIMSMNNVYYRFTHLVSDHSYRELPARLRMNVMARPGIEKVDFELCSTAVSAINGCGMCLDSHEKVLRQHGVSTEAVQSSVRIAAVINAIGQVLAVQA
jgi:lipoyl-dependent peroxiredoxin subunit D